ncbi:MAG: hypothetical protein AAF570_29620, partial [Bacteroidota bacterium]
SPQSAFVYNSGIDFYRAGPTRQHLEGQLNLPDAEGFPFVQTTYVADATGRIASQSTAGPEHHLGSGHESKFFYGTADQEDLDKLFGTEVGYAQHYRKNMAVDANGQVTVSYLDGAGNVIATALAGESPDNLLALDSNIVRTELRKDLLGGPGKGRNRRLPEEGILFSRTQFLVTASGRHEFEYEIQDQNFMDNCAFPDCYDCVYDLEISLKGECEEELLPGSVPLTMTISGGNLDLVCDANAGHVTLPDQGLYPDFFADLDIGGYTITKTLKVNEDALDFYAEAYLENNTCLKTLEDFLADQMALVDTSNCNFDCATCNQANPPVNLQDICADL